MTSLFCGPCPTRPMTQAIILALVLLYCPVMFTMASAGTIDSKLFDKWTAEIEKARKSLGIQGSSVAVVYKGKMVYAQGFGKRNDRDPFTPHTLSAIASMTKSFTAATVGELVAKGKAKWDVPVSQYLPEFKLKDPHLTSEITFIDLLAHRTGLPAIGREWVHRPESRLELIKQLQYLDAEAPLRSKYIYSDKTYTVAGEAAARIAGKPYEELVLETVARPLGMTESGFTFKKLASRPNHALPFSCKDFEAAQRGKIRRMPLDMWYYPDAPGGGMFSNVVELSNWAKAMMHSGKLDGKQILNKESVDQICTAHNILLGRSHAPEFGITTYGLGWGIGYYKGHSRIYHSGGLAGYRSFINLFPDDDFAVIHLSNNKVDQLVETVAFYIADDVLQLPKTRDWLFDVAVQDTREIYKWYGKGDVTYLEWHFPPQVKNKPPTRSLADFVGEYTHPVSGKLGFKLVKGARNGTTTTDGYALAFQFRDYDGILEHYHFDTYRLRVINDIISFSSLVTFITGDDGSVKQCRVLKDDGTYLFTKV